MSKGQFLKSSPVPIPQKKQEKKEENAIVGKPSKTLSMGRFVAEIIAQEFADQPLEMPVETLLNARQDLRKFLQQFKKEYDANSNGLGFKSQAQEGQNRHKVFAQNNSPKPKSVCTEEFPLTKKL